MKLKDLTEEQKQRLCRYFIQVYSPLDEDGMIHKTWESCAKCPFGNKEDPIYGGCNNNLEDELPEELECIAKGEI